MTALTLRHRILAAALATMAASACGDFVRQGRSPVILTIDRLEAASGASGSSPTFGGTLQSDVVTVVDGSPTVFSDAGRVSLRLTMKDVATTPTALNAVTVNRYRVVYRRADGRNTPGVDVPYPFDSAISVTVQAGLGTSHTFELVRHVAKFEAPLGALVTSAVVISTIADVTFYGRDQAGNDISAGGSIGIQFGNFGDPD